MHLHLFRFRLRAAGSLLFGSFPGPALRGALGDSREVHVAPLLASARPPAEALRRSPAPRDPPSPLRPGQLRPRLRPGVRDDPGRQRGHAPPPGRARAARPRLGRDRRHARGLADRRPLRAGAGRRSRTRGDRHRGRRRRPLPARPPPLALPGATSARPRPAPAASPWSCGRPPSSAAGSESRGALDFRSVVDELLKRVSLLSQAYGEGPVHTREEEEALLDAAAGVETEDEAVSWTEVPRYSRRQGKRMGFESGFAGWTGRVTYRGLRRALAPAARRGAPPPRGQAHRLRSRRGAPVHLKAHGFSDRDGKPDWQARCGPSGKAERGVEGFPPLRLRCRVDPGRVVEC